MCVKVLLFYYNEIKVRLSEFVRYMMSHSHDFIYISAGQVKFVYVVTCSSLAVWHICLRVSFQLDEFVAKGVRNLFIYFIIRSTFVGGGLISLL